MEDKEITLKLFSAFAGYGTDNFALKQLLIPYECIGFSEIDKYAITCFQQNHSGKCYGDIRSINPNELPDFDLFTGGFPCQSFSVAGKMGGETDTRGTLFYEIIRIAEVKQPKYMLLENVKGLTCPKFKGTFDKILSELDRIGYAVYWKVLNTKDYNIPQSRARVWFICIRKDIDKPLAFQFPEAVELKIFVKDILEDQVSSKYYLSEKLQARFKEYIKNKETKVYAMRKAERNKPKELRDYDGQQIEARSDSCSNTISTLQKDNLVYKETAFDTGHRNFRESELSPTLSTQMGTGSNNVPMVCGTIRNGGRGSIDRHAWDIIDESNKIVDILYAKKNPRVTELSPSLREGRNGIAVSELDNLRRLTPLECFRLQGFLNDEVNFKGLSDTQAYKLAGNGQSVNVVKAIFKQLLKEYEVQHETNNTELNRQG